MFFSLNNIQKIKYCQLTREFLTIFTQMSILKRKLECCTKRLKHRWELILGDSKIELPRLLRDLDSVDVFFHDSLHIYDYMMFEVKTA